MALFDEISGALSLNLSVKCTKRSQVRTWKVRKFIKGALINSNSHHTSHYIGAILNFRSNFLLYSDISAVLLIKIAGKQVMFQYDRHWQAVCERKEHTKLCLDDLHFLYLNDSDNQVWFLTPQAN